MTNSQFGSEGGIGSETAITRSASSCLARCTRNALAYPVSLCRWRGTQFKKSVWYVETRAHCRRACGMLLPSCLRHAVAVVLAACCCKLQQHATTCIRRLVDGGSVGGRGRDGGGGGRGDVGWDDDGCVAMMLVARLRA
eukprot:366037-Chlamydomonas_euryale.AAC.7